MSELTIDQALVELMALGPTATKEQLATLVSRISIGSDVGLPSERPTVLYSGGIAADIYTPAPKVSKTIERLIASNLLTLAALDNTHAGRLLAYQDFVAAVEGAVGANSFSDPYKAFMFNSIGNEGSAPGQWEQISKRFVGGLSGEVVTLTPNGSPLRTFMAAEVPALLASGTIRSVRGDSFSTSGSEYLHCLGSVPEHPRC